MRFSPQAIEEIAAKLVQMGLSTCLVCGSDSALGAAHHPVLLPTAGAPWPIPGPKDPDANVLFMVRVQCETCGHCLLFDSEKIIPSTTPILMDG